MFSHVRLRGGSNDATDARTAEYALRQILRCGLVKCADSANIHQAISFVSSAELSRSRDIEKTENLLILPFELQVKIHALCSNIIPESSIYSASVAFLAGYILKKIDDRTHCDVCLQPLLSNTIPGPLLKLILLQDRWGLVYPNEVFVGLVKRLADIAQEMLPFLKCENACKQFCTLFTLTWREIQFFLALIMTMCVACSFKWQLNLSSIIFAKSRRIC